MLLVLDFLYIVFYYLIPRFS